MKGRKREKKKNVWGCDFCRSNFLTFIDSIDTSPISMSLSFHVTNVKFVTGYFTSTTNGAMALSIMTLYLITLTIKTSSIIIHHQDTQQNDT